MSSYDVILLCHLLGQPDTLPAKDEGPKIRQAAWLEVRPAGLRLRPAGPGAAAGPGGPQEARGGRPEGEKDAELSLVPP